MGEEANARLFAAREVGRIERELDRSILYLSGDLADAIKERNKMQQETERPKGVDRTGPAVQSSRFTAKSGAKAQKDTPAAPPKKAERPDFESMPIETQCKAWDVVINKMAEARRARIASIEAKNGNRHKRREKALRALDATQPVRPTGMLASLRMKAYSNAYSAFIEVHKVKSELEQQSARLSHRLRSAAMASNEWAKAVLTRAEPELAQRVETQREKEREQKCQAKEDRGQSR
jgi:hypothetical protein